MDPSDPAFMQALGLVFDQEHGWVSPSRKGISSMPFREGQHKQLCLNCTEEFPDRDALEVHLRSCGRTAPLSSGSSNPSAPTPPGPSSKGHPSRTRTRVRTRTRTRNRTVTHGPSQRLSVSVCSLCGRNFDTRQGLAAHADGASPSCISPLPQAQDLTGTHGWLLFQSHKSTLVGRVSPNATGPEESSDAGFPQSSQLNLVSTLTTC